jgi:hypothetical protein
MSLTSRSRSRIEPNLRPASPENGNIADVAQRFPAQYPKDISNWEHRDSTPRQEAREQRASCDIEVKFTRDRTAWLARQCRCPPALPVFPANREFYREFYKITALGTPETANNCAATGLLTQIPFATKQGIILAEQGILAGEQGILLAGIEIIAG